MNTDEVLTYWATYQRSEGKGARTIADRLRLLRFIEEETGTPILELTRLDLIAYLGSERVAERWSLGTRRRYRSTIHTFYTWVQDEGIRPDNPAARLPKVATFDHDPNPVHVNDIALMVSTGAYRKTRMMIALHYYAGLRVHEIAKMHGRDIDWNNAVLSVQGKGGRIRRLGISDALWALMQDFPRDAYWFPNHRANRFFAAGEGHIVSNSVSDAIRDAYLRSGITGHRPHDLRASTATEQLDAGVNSLKTQRAMRHVSYATTERYTRLAIEATREAFNAQPVIPFPERSGRRRAA
jgi:integrase/recombinase XerD